jgi:hypothetical protein
MAALREAMRRVRPRPAPPATPPPTGPWAFYAAMAYTPPRDPSPCTLDVDDLNNPGFCVYCAEPIPHE